MVLDSFSVVEDKNLPSQDSKVGEKIGVQNKLDTFMLTAWLVFAPAKHIELNDVKTQGNCLGPSPTVVKEIRELGAFPEFPSLFVRLSFSSGAALISLYCNSFVPITKILVGPFVSLSQYECLIRHIICEAHEEIRALDACNFKLGSSN